MVYYSYRNRDAAFSELLNQTIVNIKDLSNGSDAVEFVLADGRKFVMYHSQNCCESVYIEDINGDVEDLLHSPITLAEASTSGENPPDYAEREAARKAKLEAAGQEYYAPYQDSFTWTFYRLGTIKGTVVIRWYGESNGYYSESVDFSELTKKES
jgi:hypothetical protein